MYNRRINMSLEFLQDSTASLDVYREDFINIAKMSALDAITVRPMQTAEMQLVDPTTPLVERLLLDLNTLGGSLVAKRDIYNYLMGDYTSLDKYKGDRNNSKEGNEKLLNDLRTILLAQ